MIDLLGLVAFVLAAAPRVPSLDAAAMEHQAIALESAAPTASMPAIRSQARVRLREHSTRRGAGLFVPASPGSWLAPSGLVVPPSIVAPTAPLIGGSVSRPLARSPPPFR
jgi:hypothetical protein